MITSSLRKVSRFRPFGARVLEPSERVNLGSYVSLPPGYHPMNPSIARVGNGYVVCVRGVNYRYPSKRKLAFEFTVGDTFQTINRFVVLNGNLELIRAVDSLNENADINQLEDVRLFVHRGTLHASAARPVAAAEGKAKRLMSLISFDSNLEIVSSVDIASPFGRQVEKNWSPFSRADGLCFMYSFSPNVILRVDPLTGLSELDDAGVALRDRSPGFLDCGSTPGIAYGLKTLFVTHRRSFDLRTMSYVYSNRFYVFSDDGANSVRGDYFSIGPRQLQFINGMHLENDSILLSYGAGDNEAFLARFAMGDLPARVLPGFGANHALSLSAS